MYLGKVKKLWGQSRCFKQVTRKNIVRGAESATFGQIGLTSNSSKVSDMLLVNVHYILYILQMPVDVPDHKITKETVTNLPMEESWSCHRENKTCYLSK